MNFGTRRGPLLLSMASAAVLSILFALVLPKEFLTADILMQSVMSLQNVTLFYWGQNRLANVLPLGLVWIGDPQANLAVMLLFAAMSFHFLVLMLSRHAAAAVIAADVDTVALKTCLLVSAVIAVSFTPRGLFEISIAHIEYSLPALALLGALHASVLRVGWTTGSLAMTAVTSALAIGVNPSTVLPGLFIAAVAAMYRKRAGMGELALAGSCLVAYFAWSFIAGLHGSNEYASFDPSIVARGVSEVAKGMPKLVNVAPLSLALGSLALARILTRARGQGHAEANRRAARFLRNGAAMFMAGWLLLFAGNPWVAENDYSWRYFIYIIFGALFYLSVSVARLVSATSLRTSATAAAGGALLSFAVTFSPPVPWEDYKVFREVRPYARPGIHLYSGDYWTAWPLVLKDMMEGHEAYGLTIRGEANAKAARTNVLGAVRREGYASVLCVNETPDECVRQIAAVLGPSPCPRVIRQRDRVHEIRLGDCPAGLDYAGAAFLGLPSQVGLIDGDMKRSDGHAGFLIYGPYASLGEGRYRLELFGSSAEVGGAYVDVVSANASRQHGRFPLRIGSDGFLAVDGAVALPADAFGVEVRVWVSEASKLQLTGYRLSRD